jgi:hypothetical protein
LNNGVSPRNLPFNEKSSHATLLPAAVPVKACLKLPKSVDIQGQTFYCKSFIKF